MSNVVKFRRPKPEKPAKPNGAQPRAGNSPHKSGSNMHLAVWLPWVGLLVVALAIYLLRGSIG